LIANRFETMRVLAPLGKETVMSKLMWTFLTMLTVCCALGCGGGTAPSAANSAYVVKTEPAGALAVGDARSSVKDQQEVVVVGRIGGSVKPFVEGVAAFTIVDLKVPYCAPDEGCPTPWDYCCEQGQVKSNIAMVKVVDSQGQPVAQDARALLGVAELNTVVVRGRAERDADGNLAVLAQEVFLRK